MTREHPNSGSGGNGSSAPATEAPLPRVSRNDADCPAMPPPRVVITGAGVLSGNASTLTEFRDTVRSGRSALGRLKHGAARNWPFSSGSQVDPSVLRDRGLTVGSGDAAMALYAAQDALAASALTAPQLASCALVVGCVLYHERSHVADVIGDRCSLGRDRYVVDAACSSGSHAIVVAWNLIRQRRVTAALVVSYNTMLLKDVAGLLKLGILTRDPVRPFDARRTGTQPGEGAGAVVLEAFEHAQARRAPIVCEIAGVGLGADAHQIVPPRADGRGLGIAITGALRSAGLVARDVDYINAHGTGTRLNDPSETAAIHAALGDDAYKVPVSSTKPITGHTLGAAGMLEAIVAMLATRDDFVPPTLNHEVPDPLCDLDYVAGQTKYRPVNVALSNSSGFGGLYSCIAFKKSPGTEAARIVHELGRN